MNIFRVLSRLSQARLVLFNNQVVADENSLVSGQCKTIHQAGWPLWDVRREVDEVQM